MEEFLANWNRGEASSLKEYAEALEVSDTEIYERLEYYNKGVPYHVMRLCDTVKGFHVGSLDLSGRHRRRYTSAYKRWLEFGSGIGGIVRYISDWHPHITENSDRKGGESRELVDEETFIVELVRLRMEFERKWSLPAPSNTRIFMDLAVQVMSCMKQHRYPKFQRICLLDLPPEMLEHIAQFCGRGTYHVRKFGILCKMLRAVSLPYIYTNFDLSMKIDYRRLGDSMQLLPENDKVPFLYRMMRSAQEAFMEAGIFIVNAPDIARRVESFYSSAWGDRVLEAYYYHSTRNRPRAYLGVLFSFSHNLARALSSMLNVRRIELRDVVITVALAKQLTSLPQLATLLLHHCIVTSKLRRVISKPNSVRELHLHFGRHQPEHSVWKLVELFPHLRILSADASTVGQYGANASDHPVLLPFIDSLGKPNPFTLTTLTHVELHFLAIIQWGDLISLLAQATWGGTRPLPLTHLTISVLDPLTEQFISDLLDVLHLTLLQEIYLNGILYAELSLFTRLCQVLPKLTSLTLMYRKGPSQKRPADAIWPHASWEYAQAIALFPRLSHFGWNYLPQTIISPRVILNFEDDFASLELGDPEEGEGEEEEEDEDEGELYGLTGLFARMCPNLQTFKPAGHLRYQFKPWEER